LRDQGTRNGLRPNEIQSVPAAGTLRASGSPVKIGAGESSMARETMRGLERGLSVLKALERSDGLALRELHHETKLPKPTLLRILSTLEENGYARRRMTDGTWRRAARRSETPRSLLHDLLLDVGGVVLDDLCQRIAWPSDLAIYHRGMMHILETTRKKTPYAVNMTGIGYRVPMLQTGLGRA
jgi:IclR family mhp operon transcriptional activator